MTIIVSSPKETHCQPTFVELTAEVTSKHLPTSLSLRIYSEKGRVHVSTLDWAAVLLILPAMRAGEAIHLNGRVTASLLFVLNTDVQALLRTYEPGLKPIILTADETVDAPPRRPLKTATGFSAGIDSFATLARYGSQSTPDSLRVSDICVFNVGAVGAHNDPATTPLYERYLERAREFARVHHYGVHGVHTNADEFYTHERERFQLTHTLRNAAAALALQDHVGAFLYSSTVPYDALVIGPSNDIARMDPVLLGLISQGSLTFISACAGLSRIEKTKLVAEAPQASDLLDVCVAPTESRVASKRPNCSKCWKCARTMITLDRLGLLERFGQVFDLAYWQHNRAALEQSVMRKALRGSPIDREVVDFAQSVQRPLSSPFHVWARVRMGEGLAFLRKFF